MSQSVFIRQRVRLSKPDGTVEATAEFVSHAFEPGFFCGLVNGEQKKYHRDNVLKTWRVTREVDRDGHPQEEVVEEI